MRRLWQRVVWGLATLVFILMAIVPAAMAAQISAGGGGSSRSGGSGGSGGGASRSTQCPPPPGEPDPPGCLYIKDTYTRDATDSEIEKRKAFYIGTGRWEWWSDVSYPWFIEWDPGYPQYNVWRYDPTADKPLRYDFVGIRSEGPYYIEDEYRPLVRKFYDEWQLEHGRVYAKSLWWSEVQGWPTMIVYVRNDGRSFSMPTGTYNPNRTSVTFNNNKPLHGIHYCPATCAEDFPNANSRSPRRPLVKNPPIYDTNPDGREKPPIASPPLDWLGDQIDCNNCRYKDVYDPNGVFLFGGRPARNLFSATRGTNAILAIDALAQGDPRVPPALNKVTQVIIRIPDIPGSPQAKAALIEGNAQKGRWLTSLPIDPRTKVGKYKVVFEISGTNYWGMTRRKIVEGQIWIDGGDCPATDRSCQRKPGEVSYCGLSEEQMRELGPVWEYRCRDPRLIR